MKIECINVDEDMYSVQQVVKNAFSSTSDSSINEWFSFNEMINQIKMGRGVCVKAISEDGTTIGMTYAQQENPINGREGLEKWVIVLAAVDPGSASQGVGSLLLKEIEQQALQKSAIKMFVYTNSDDDRVIHFYKKNGYEDAGWIKDYQYGSGNSAVFLLKNLKSS